MTNTNKSTTRTAKTNPTVESPVDMDFEEMALKIPLRTYVQLSCVCLYAPHCTHVFYFCSLEQNIAGNAQEEYQATCRDCGRELDVHPTDVLPSRNNPFLGL